MPGTNVRAQLRPRLWGRLARAVTRVVWVAMLLPAVPARANDPARNVLILTAEGGGIDDRSAIESLQKTVRERWPSRVRFYQEDVSTAPFSPEAYRRDLPAYLREKHSGRVDLVVALSRPALEFVLANRGTLFDAVPILFGGGGVSVEELEEAGITGAVVKPEPGRTIALALELHPSTTQIALVGGTGATDRQAEERVRREMAPFAGKVSLTSLTDLPVSELLQRVGGLPAHTIVFYTRVTRDVTGAAFAPGEVLQLVRRATAAPIYGCSRAYLGAGVVGGVLVDHPLVGTRLGEMAGRLLAGESAANVHPIVAENTVSFDARELGRLGLREQQLPRGALIEFRDGTRLQRFPSSHPLYFTLLSVAALSLVVALFAQYRVRRRVQEALDDRSFFETTFADVSTTFIRLAGHEIDTAMRGALQRMLEVAGADRVVVYEATASLDSPWKARFSEARYGSGVTPVLDDWHAERSPWLISRLRAGQVVTFLDGENREHLVESAPGTPAPEAAVAVPLAVGPAILGVLWCIWHRPVSKHLGRDTTSERFRLSGELFANALRRSQMEARLAESRDLNAAILESLILHVAVLDRSGTIISVNDAWMTFGRRNDIAAESAISPGANYLAAARKGADEGAPLAREAFEGIRAVCEGRRELFTLEYECSSPGEQRWFLMTVASLRRKEGGAVVTHRDITESKRIEMAIRESEARFRVLADALPLGVWMSDANARRVYFNRAWLNFTGSDLEQQLGDGWIDSLHPDDRPRYLEARRAAFAARQPISIEYRLRRHDGHYGWFIDTAVPRYGSDGTFHGFVGGCVDVTERRETEDTLRDLAGRVITAEEEDRRRIARDLHDGVNQCVALLAIELEQLGQTPIRSESDLAARAHALWKRTAEISSELHRVSHALHPSRLETFGLVAALEGYCAEISTQQQVRVVFSHEEMPGWIPPELALCVFRIVQEALRNVIKHSGAADAVVELSGGPARLSLLVWDTGRGFDTAQKNRGLGLVSMRERVRYSGGELTILSRPGEGTRIEVELPLRASAEPAGLASQA